MLLCMWAALSPVESQPLWWLQRFVPAVVVACCSQTVVASIYLQAPLQPLQDNLESTTYEVFEKDTIKYTQYEAAVFKCLMDRVTQQQADAGKVTVLMVVGAGRGPLVAASLVAAAKSGRRIKVYAVEKNPNAVVTLQHRIVRDGWQDTVRGRGWVSGPSRTVIALGCAAAVFASAMQQLLSSVYV